MHRQHHQEAAGHTFEDRPERHARLPQRERVPSGPVEEAEHAGVVPRATGEEEQSEHQRREHAYDRSFPRQRKHGNRRRHRQIVETREECQRGQRTCRNRPSRRAVAAAQGDERREVDEAR